MAGLHRGLPGVGTGIRNPGQMARRVLERFVKLHKSHIMPGNGLGLSPVGCS